MSSQGGVPRWASRMEVMEMTNRAMWAAEVMEELEGCGRPTDRVGPPHRFLGAIPSDYGMSVWSWLMKMPGEMAWAVSDRLYQYALPGLSEGVDRE